MARTKVYGWQGYRTAAYGRNNYHGQTREIVAAPSQASAARAAGIPVSRIRNWGGETGNPDEIATAMAAPGVVFWRPLDARTGGWTRAD